MQRRAALFLNAMLHFTQAFPAEFVNKEKGSILKALLGPSVVEWDPFSQFIIAEGSCCDTVIQSWMPF